MVALSVVGVALLALACWLTFLSPIGTPRSLARLLIWLPFILLFAGAAIFLWIELRRVARTATEYFNNELEREGDNPEIRIRDRSFRRTYLRLRSLAALLLVATILGLSVLAWVVVATPTEPAVKINQPIQVLVFPEHRQWHYKYLGVL